MSGVVTTLRSSLPRPTLRSVATAPFRPRTYGNLLYLGLAFPLGLAEFLFVTVGLSLSVGLAVLAVGVALFVAVLLAAILLATGERLLATALLGVDIDAPEWRVLAAEEYVDRLKGLVLDRAVWKALAFLVSRLAIGVGAFTVLVSLLVPTFVLVATPFYYRVPGARVGLFLPHDITRELSLYVPWNELLVGVEFVVRLTSWEVDTLPEALLVSAVGVVVLVLVLNVLNGAAWLCGRWAKLLLGPGWPALPWERGRS
jgi:hypothetical protein